MRRGTFGRRILYWLTVAIGLALAIVLDYTNDTRLSLQIYQAFKWRFIADMPEVGGTIEAEQINAFIEEMKQEMREPA